MRVSLVALAAVAVSAGGVAQADAEKCFDKGTLTYIDCPSEAAAVVATEPAPDPEPIHDWTGFYVGAHAGYGWADNSVSLGPTVDGASVRAFNADILPRSLDHSLNGLAYGAQIGYAHQIDRFVLGAEADFSLTDMDGSASFFSNVNTETTTTETTEVNWLSTVRARAGYTILPELLVFATGGLAIADVDRSGSTAAPGAVLGPQIWSYSSSDVRVGWTLGGGAEVALTESVSLKGEYLYVDLGSEKNTAGPITPRANVFGPTGAFNDSDDLTAHLARIGLNVHF